jgi:hypothetical protein
VLGDDVSGGGRRERAAGGGGTERQRRAVVAGVLLRPLHFDRIFFRTSGVWLGLQEWKRRGKRGEETSNVRV